MGRKNEKPPFNPFSASEERDALCKRLGIKLALEKDIKGKAVFGNMSPQEHSQLDDPLIRKFDEILVWAEIGYSLAKEQPEFSGTTRRGRPSLQDEKRAGIDYDRATHIRNLRRRLLAEGKTTALTDAALVDHAMDEEAALFEAKERDLLVASVSRGNAKWRKLEKELITLWAGSLRKECIRFRERAKWLDGIKDDVEHLDEVNRSSSSFGLLYDNSFERMALQSRLINPFRGLGE